MGRDRNPAVLEETRSVARSGDCHGDGVPLATVRHQLAGLAATGAVITCNLTRYEKGKRIDAWQCRVSGYIPPLSPGRKPKPTT
jgi:hypothetical protein